MANYCFSAKNENKKELIALLREEPHIPYWLLAQEMGRHENTILKYMREPNDFQTAQIKAAIQRIGDKQLNGFVAKREK